MPLYTNFADVPSEVDVIIAGGGTAGCIVAGRLAEADPSLSVLVVEAGANNRDEREIVTPALYLNNFVPAAKRVIFRQANLAPQLADRRMIVISGGVLGGGSSVNFMMYTRAQRSDLDGWNMPGWSAAEAVPFLRRLETYHGDAATTKWDVHGTDGPIHITGDTYRAREAEDDFVQAAARLGWPELTDLQDLDSNNGSQRWKRYVGPDGRRQDTAHRYVHPKLDGGDCPNLHVLVGARVVRVLVDGHGESKRAVGIECTPNEDLQPAVGNLTDQQRGTVFTFGARRLVVVSCGALGTPPVLERSGIGGADFLARAGVPVVEDLPAVGAEYQDHHHVFLPFRTNLGPRDTIDDIAAGRVDVAAMVAERDPIMSWNGIDVALKVRPLDEDVAALGPEFKAAYDKDFGPYPNRPLMLLVFVNSFLGDHIAAPPGQFITIGSMTAYPYSRGHVHITGPSISDPLDFDVGYLSDEHDFDIKVQLWGYKKSREIMRRTRLYRGELAAAHPAFPAGSAAAVVELGEGSPLPDPADVKDLVYSREDDEAIMAWLRLNLTTTWHSLGTCKCAPREKGGVVDERLSVYGVGALKVVDLSVQPVNVGGNVANTAMLIGERGADIILRELGVVKGA